MQFINQSSQVVRVEVYSEVQTKKDYLVAQVDKVEAGARATLNVQGSNFVFVLSEGGNQLGSGPGRVAAGATVTFTGTQDLQVT
jgi:hypothetical protein